MIYKVTGRYREEKLPEFYEKLTDGTVQRQRPDGPSIVSAMKGAKITEPGVIEWFETCYCATPLRHERATVYDFYLSDISTELVDDFGEVEGEPFWFYLEGSSTR